MKVSKFTLYVSIGEAGNKFLFVNTDIGKILNIGSRALEKAKDTKKSGDDVLVFFKNFTENYEMSGSLTEDGIFIPVYKDNKKTENLEKIDLNSLDVSKQLAEAVEMSKFLVILNFDSDVAILFKKEFDKKNALHLKKLEKGKLDEVLDHAYEKASDINNEVNYQIVVEQDGFPVCFELGFITPDLDLIPKRSEEEEKINESLPKNVEDYDYFLELKSLRDKDATLYRSNRETDKTDEYYDQSAINKSKEVAKAGILMSITVGSGKVKKDGFLIFKDGKFFIEIERKSGDNKFEEIKL